MLRQLTCYPGVFSGDGLYVREFQGIFVQPENRERALPVSEYNAIFGEPM